MAHSDGDMDGKMSGAAPPAARPVWARLLPIALLATAAILFLLAGGQRYLSFDALAANYAALETLVDERFWLSLAFYMLAYIAVAALSLPGATVMSVLGGFLFGIVVGTAAVVCAATIGATIIFLAARTAFADFFRRKASSFLLKMEKGFSDNAFSYLLLLRLIPLFPFFVVNVVPAFTRIGVGAFVAATFIGVIPGAFAFVSAGNGLGAVLSTGEALNLSGVLTQPAVLTPIIALSLLALIPVIYRVATKRSRKTHDAG